MAKGPPSGRLTGASWRFYNPRRRHSAISRRSSSSVRRQPEPGFARVDPLRGRVSEQLQESHLRGLPPIALDRRSPELRGGVCPTTTFSRRHPTPPRPLNAA